MPLKRPAPLSDAAFGGKPPLGVTNDGYALPVKNTFIDVPSGLTPTSVKARMTRSLMSAPPELSHPGFMQRAMGVSSQTAQQAMPPTPGTARTMLPMATYMATPDPMAAPMMMVQGSQVVHSGFAAALAAAGASGTGPTTVSSSSSMPGQPVPYPFNAGSYVASSAGASYAACPTLAPSSSMPTGFVPAYGAPGGSPSPRSSTAPTMLMYSQATTYQQAAAKQAQAGATLEEGDDEEDDSDGEIVPPHLRNLENAPQPPPGAIHPSLGSEGHESAQCKRCCFFPRGRCTNGYNCEFCHYEHEKRKRKNKKKKKKDASAVPAGSITTLQPIPMVQAMPQQMQYGAPPLVFQTAPQPMQSIQFMGAGTQPSAATMMFAPTSTLSTAPSQQIQHCTAPPQPMQYIAQPSAHHPMPQLMPQLQPQVMHMQPAPQAANTVTATMPMPHAQNVFQVFDPTPPPPPQSPKVSSGPRPPLFQSSPTPAFVPPPPMCSPKFPVNVHQTLVHAVSR